MPKCVLQLVCWVCVQLVPQTTRVRGLLGLTPVLDVVSRRVVAEALEQHVLRVYCGPLAEVGHQHRAEVAQVEALALHRHAERAQCALVEQEEVQCGASAERVGRANTINKAGHGGDDVVAQAALAEVVGVVALLEVTEHVRAVELHRGEVAAQC